MISNKHVSGAGHINHLLQEYRIYSDHLKIENDTKNIGASKEKQLFYRKQTKFIKHIW